MKTPVKAVVFDMDGLMFDTEPLFRAAAVNSLEILGYHVSEEFCDNLTGKNVTDAAHLFMQELGKDFPFEKARDLWISEWMNLVKKNGVQAKPGLFDVLELLDDNKVPYGVATSNDRELTTFLLDFFLIRHRFKSIVTGDMVNNGKPSPDIYLKAARNLNVKPDACIAFEDSNPGAVAAVHAGMTTIMVPDMHEVMEDVKLLIYRELSSLKEAIPVLSKFFNNRQPPPVFTEGVRMFY